MNVIDLFSGIGGFTLGLEKAGLKTIAFCEQDKYAQKVLKKHWPNIPIFDDVRNFDGKKFRGAVDVVCGGFPCQDVSVAGKKTGVEGERTSLYREMLRIISECLPRYAIFENVTGLLTGESGRWFAQFLFDLAEIGYDAEWHCISASELGANHHRDRVWIIAYTDNNGSNATKIRQGIQKGDGGNQKGKESAKQFEGLPGKRLFAKPDMQRCERSAKIAHNLKQQIESMRSFETERRRQDISSPALCGADDGIPNRSHRLKCLGNAVVPQIPEVIGKAIMAQKMAEG